jgi:RNA polymerase sigma-70 factor (ECF subfamily)
MTEAGNDLEGLVAAANDGDRSALNRVLAIIRPLVVRYCRARIGRNERSSVSADDVAQEVCLAVLTALPGYRDQGRPFLAFVYGIAAHKVVDAHRSVARSRSEPVEELPEELDPRDGPEQRALNGALSVQMGQLLDTLPPKQREILVLRVVVGLSAEETAEAVESTPGAVRVAQHRALSKLRTAVSAISEEVS